MVDKLHDTNGPLRGSGGSEMVELGRLVRRHGVRGEIRLFPYNPDSATLHTQQEVALSTDRAALEWMRIASLRRHQKYILLRFEGVETANDADLLIGRALSVPRDQLPQLAEDEIYHCDLIGCRVFIEGGDEIGVVDQILPTGSNDVLVVRSGSREHLIPWIDDVVADVDPDAARIVVRAVPGLLDP